MISLTNNTIEAPGVNCADGGIKVETGLDTDLSGILEAGEVTATTYVCNGANGTAGANGTNGTNGVDGAVGPAGANGTNGTNGTNGVSINWLGSFAAAPGSPALNDAYYDTALLQSYIWNGSAWNVIAKDGADGALTAWSLLGNTGTLPTTNFIGAIDSVDIVFRTNNNEKMRITANGNFGIGTTTPSALLQVESSNSPSIYLKESVATNGAALLMESNQQYMLISNQTGFFRIQNNTTFGNPFNISAAGNIGIGADPSVGGKFQIFHTASTANPTLHLRESTGNLNRIKFTNNTVANKYWETAAQTSASDALAGWSVNYYDGTTYRSHIISYGNGNLAIGHGILAPNSSLMDVFGSTTIHDTLTIDNGTSKKYSFPLIDGTANYIMRTNGAGIVSWVDPNSLGISGPWTSDGTQTYLNTLTDKVGIGTATPQSKLHVLATSGTLNIIAENSGGANFQTGHTIKTATNEWFMGQEGTAATGFRITDIDAASPRLQIDQVGNVGIGTTTAKSKLSVNGDLGLNDGATVASNNAVTILLTNSGPALNAGDIVIVGTDNSFTTTNTNANYAVIGVAIEGIGNGSIGKIAISGVVTVNTVVGVTRGQHCITSATVGKAMGISTPSAGTSIGVYLTNEAAGKATVLLR